MASSGGNPGPSVTPGGTIPGNFDTWSDGCAAEAVVAETEAGDADDADDADEDEAGGAALALVLEPNDLPPGAPPPRLLPQPVAETGAITGATIPAGAGGAALAAGAAIAALVAAAELCASLATVPLAPVAGSPALPEAEPASLCESAADSVGASPADAGAWPLAWPDEAAPVLTSGAVAGAGGSAASGAGGASAAVGGGGGAWPRYERSPLSPVDAADRPAAAGGPGACPTDAAGLKEAMAAGVTSSWLDRGLR